MVLWHYKIITGVLLLSIGVNLMSSFAFDLKSNEVLYESKLIMKSLEEALKYLEKRPENVSGDVILGIFIAKSNLQWIIKRLESTFGGSPWANKELKQLLKHCRNIIAFHKSENVLLKENLWNDAAGNLKYGFLRQADLEFILPTFNSCQSIDIYMMNGTPEDSNFCINELITSRCKVSDYCWLSEINGGVHSGYKTSHRLLYFQVACKIRCDKLNPTKFSAIDAVKNKLCQQMLLEAMALFKSSSLFLTQDLFMEQIALCGLEGYEEFGAESWRDQVRSWQNYNGCFGRSLDIKNCSDYKPVTKKIKRTDFVIDECHSHVTAVAISALAFFVRVTLKMAFNLA